MASITSVKMSINHQSISELQPDPISRPVHCEAKTVKSSMSANLERPKGNKIKQKCAVGAGAGPGIARQGGIVKL
jgi:hypothetical protein